MIPTAVVPININLIFTHIESEVQSDFNFKGFSHHLTNARTQNYMIYNKMGNF